MNRVTLESWYDQPIHCPFCGSAIGEEGAGQCEHWLYTAYDSFIHIGKPASKILSVSEQNIYDGDLSEEVFERYGDKYKVIAYIQEKAFNLVEFHLTSPGDSTLFGFAPLARELVYWGHDHVSPYEAIFENSESQDSTNS